MNLRIMWLPVGHIAHGYRRVFTIFDEGRLVRVVNFTPMPYEAVFQLREMVRPDEVSDPSLLWGLSIIQNLIQSGELWSLGYNSAADDGYLQMRPSVLTVEDVMPMSEYHQAITRGVHELVDAKAQKEGMQRG